MKLISNRLTPWTTASYSQSGEDRIIDFFINTTGLQNATYLDIGSSHPIRGNNTYLLYKKGLRGTCVDPSPGLASLYRENRPKDEFIAAALVPGAETSVTMQLFNEDTLNTVSTASADLYSGFGFSKRESVVIPATSLDRLFTKCAAKVPDILCLDIEGLDFDVLHTAHFETEKPKLICVETVQYLEDKSPTIDHRFVRMLESKGYIKYADTFINQIFVDKVFQSKQRFV